MAECPLGGHLAEGWDMRGVSNTWGGGGGLSRTRARFEEQGGAS